ncbi:MAG TPA: polysaccharide pyruvyl transferase family protein, partial [Thermoanaerobaculia bacterium]|nr:polysaccharide pyruvyl transferase family protein [Thermoanaerobaculia bacterium]
VVVCNDGVGSPNKGDQAILRAMLRELSAIEGVQIACFPFSGGRRPRERLRLLWAVVRADVFVLGGGHPFQDLTSQLFLLFGLALILLAKLTGATAICYAVGVGPIGSRLGRAVTGRVLRYADEILVRDPVSRDLLIALGVPSQRLTLTADAAFALPAAPAERVDAILRAEGLAPAAGPWIAVCPRRWFTFRHRLLPAEFYRRSESEEAATGAVTRALVELLDWLCGEQGFHVLFVPSRRSILAGRDRGQDDDLYSREILAAMGHGDRATVLAGDYEPEELKGILARMDLVLSVRMHPLVFASACGVPVIGIPFTRAKGEGLFSLLGLDSYLDIEAVDGERLRQLFLATWERREEIREQLRRRAPELARAARRNAEALCRHVDAARARRARGGGRR